MIMTRKNRFKNNQIFHFIIFTPGIVFTLKAFHSSLFTSGFIFKNNTIYETGPVINSWSVSFLIMTIFMSTSCLILIFLWAKNSDTKREKKQAVIYISTILISIACVYFINVLPGMFLDEASLSYGHFFFIIWLIGIWYSINKYKLMVLTPDIAVETIISHMMDVLILINPDKTIIMVNNTAEELLDRKSQELLNFNIAYLFKDREAVEENIFDTKELGQQHFIGDIFSRNKESIPVEVSVSPIYEESGDLMGYVLVAHDLRHLVKLQNERDKLQNRNSVIESELQMARSIQKQIIPSHPNYPGLAFYYKPMDLVGGDFFDFISFRDHNNIGIFISDVSGHGVPAAFITSMIKSYILQTNTRRNNPTLLLESLNDFLKDHTAGNFVTALYCIIDIGTKKLRYASAGHNNPIVISKNSVEELSHIQKGAPLGIWSTSELKDYNKSFETSTIDLSETERLFLYTDGLTEAIPEGKTEGAYEDICFGEDGLMNILARYNENTAKEIVNSVIDDLIDFRGSSNFDDDVCFICLEI